MSGVPDSSATYRAKAEEYERLAATVEPPFKEALLDVAAKWRTMAEEADAEHNPYRAFAERLRCRLGLLSAADLPSGGPDDPPDMPPALRWSSDADLSGLPERSSSCCPHPRCRKAQRAPEP